MTYPYRYLLKNTPPRNDIFLFYTGWYKNTLTGNHYKSLKSNFRAETRVDNTIEIKNIFETYLNNIFIYLFRFS